MQTSKQKTKSSPSTRSYWEDPQKKFMEWAEARDWSRSFWGRWFLEFERRFYLSRVFFVFVFCMILSFIVFYQVRPPINLRIGQVASVDVNSPVAFDMIDELTTEEKRIRAQKTVADVYDFDPEVLVRIISNVDKAFRNMKMFGREVRWPKSALRRESYLKPFFNQKPIFEKDLRVSVQEDVYEWLVDNQFNSKIENAVVKTLVDWYQKKIVELSDRTPTPNQELVARTISKNTTALETRLKVSDVLDLRNSENFVLADSKLVEKFDDADKAFLLRFARSLIQANLTVNKSDTSLRKQKARDDVLAVNVSIKKNQTVIPKGSVVQPFHMAIIRQMEALQEERRRGQMMISLAFLLATAILVFTSFQRKYSPFKFQVENKDLFVMMVLLLSQVFFTKIYLYLVEISIQQNHAGNLVQEFFMALTPVLVSSMLIGLLIVRSEIVWFFTAINALCLGVMNDLSLTFFAQSIIGGIAAARGVHGCKTRNDIYLAGLRAGGINAIVLMCFEFMIKLDHETSWGQIGAIGVGGFVGGIFSSLIAMMLVPFLESVFNYTTDVKLLELSNLNHPLLKEMIMKSPGTYHHSIMVGNMVEAAAEEIGANPLLGKVMSYYHDIGKMEHAKYFIENQKTGHNPHDQISPFMSKTLLIAHVKDGFELGMKYKLGKPILDGILQHHGTTLISFFYHKALELRQEGDPEISEDEFRYPGPKPQFKEAALCMLADSIEAAVRSLDEPTPSRMQSIVKNIIQKKFSDGQLDECNLTIREVAKIEAAFIRILLGVYHQRIDYPRSVGS